MGSPLIAASSTATASPLRFPSRSRWPSSARTLGIAFAIATAIALVFTVQMLISYRYVGDERQWSDVLVASLVDWWSWALLVPAIAETASRVPLGAPPRYRSIAIQLGAAGLFVGLHALMVASILPALYWPIAWAPWRDVFLGQINRSLATSAIVYGLIIAICNAARHVQLSREAALAAERDRTLAANAKLDALRAQLRPHFLFNALNGATELVESDPVNAAHLLRSLAELLRQALRRDADDISLAEEIALLELYVGIEHLRFSDAFTVSFDIAADVRDVRLPGLILQPLVENAIRYGVRRDATQLHVGVRAFRRGDSLHIDVVDNGPGLSRVARSEERPGQGIGLANTAARLQARYHDRARVRLTNSAESGCISHIELPVSVSGP